MYIFNCILLLHPLFMAYLFSPTSYVFVQCKEQDDPDPDWILWALPQYNYINK